MDMIDLLNCIVQLLKNNIALIDCLTVVQGRGQEEGVGRWVGLKNGAFNQMVRREI